MQCPYSRFKSGTDFVKMIFILERGTFWCTQSDPTRYAIGEFKLICFRIDGTTVMKCRAVISVLSVSMNVLLYTACTATFDYSFIWIIKMLQCPLPEILRVPVRNPHQRRYLQMYGTGVKYLQDTYPL